MSPRLLLLLASLFFLTSCHFMQKDEAQQDLKSDDRKETVSVSTDNSVESLKAEAKKEKKISKSLRESIYFANSLEREAMKLITKDGAWQRPTLFSVLSFITEIEAGVKKSTPMGLDCGTYDVQTSPTVIDIYKTCVRPKSLVVSIRTLKAEENYQFEFMSREWPSVLGLSVSLTAPHIVCDMKIKEKKLQSLNCDNWQFQVSEDQLSSTVVKLTEFRFQRDAVQQFVLKGGFFKELVENKKIDIVVPLEGKIKVIEKEIEVIDEFAEKTKEEVHVQKEENKAEDKTEQENQDDQSRQNDYGGQEAGGVPRDLPQEGQIENQGGQKIPNQSQDQNQNPQDQQESRPGARKRGR